MVSPDSSALQGENVLATPHRRLYKIETCGQDVGRTRTEQLLGPYVLRELSMILRICNFKSIKDTQLPLRTGLTVLVGPNGSGKTCALSSLKFVRDLFLRGAAQAIARSGGRQRVYRHGSSRMQFSIVADYGPRTYRRRSTPCTFSWKINIAQVGKDKAAAVTNETLSIEVAGEGQLFSASLHRPRGKPHVTVSCTAAEDVGGDFLNRWPREYARHPKAIRLKEFIKEIRASLRRFAKACSDRSFLSWLARYDSRIADAYHKLVELDEYNIVPELARASTDQLSVARMEPDGRSVSEVIYALEHRQYGRLQPRPDDVDIENDWDYPVWSGYNPYGRLYIHRRRYWYMKHDPMMSALSSINRELAAAVRPITGVGAAIDPSNGRRYVKFVSDTDEFRPEEVSDGTIKWLCILVSLFVPFAPVYLLEEPENFLHPWMQQRLIDLMREQARLANTVFVLSSHSATVLNATKPEEVLLVTQGKSGTKLSSVSNPQEVQKVLEASKFHLGDLWVSGALGGVPSHE